MGQADRTIYLPLPDRGGWRFMLLVSSLVVALGGWLLLRDVAAIQTEPLSGAFGLLGAGLFLGCFALLMLNSRQPAVSLQARPGERVLRLYDQRGAHADLPAASLLRALAPMNPSDGRGQVVALHKRDGGVIELSSASDDEQAAQLVSHISNEISEMQAQRGAAERWNQADERALPSIRGVALRRDGDELLLRWSAGASLRNLVGVGCPAGLGVIGIAALRQGAGLPISLFTGFCFTLALVVAASVLWTQGLRMSVRLSDTDVAIEHRRFGRLIKRQQLAIATIKAVDYTHQLNSAGGGVSLRSHDLTASLEQLAELSTPKQAFSNAFELMRAIGDGVQLPCGDLPLASKIALDMLLSEELARRSRRSPAEL